MMVNSTAFKTILEEAPARTADASPNPAAQTSELLGRYRESGYLHADINPLDADAHAWMDSRPPGHRHVLRGALALQGPAPAALEEQLHRSYCGGLALNATHVRNHVQADWLYEHVEAMAAAAPVDAARQAKLYELLFAAERFEQAIASRYPAHKRFSLEGSESTLVFLHQAIETAAGLGARRMVVGMPHRGRLNVLANIMGLDEQELRSLFTEAPAPHLAAWDIKEHLGLLRELPTARGPLEVLVAHNPSHLEAVTPVVTGMARALQEASPSHPRDRVVPLIVHGDASFSGQGIVTETFNLAGTRGYGVGGSVHVVLNNQIGSTVSHLRDARSTLNSADVARAYDVPILHVNGDMPEHVARAAALAIEFRQRFHADILVDIVGYRRHGHNGHDDPRVTQPAMQRTIRALPTVVQRYREQVLRDGRIDEARLADCERRVIGVGSLPLVPPGPGVGAIRQAGVQAAPGHATSSPGVPFDRLAELVTALAAMPDGFRLHADILALVQGWRHAASDRAHAVDWCLAETLAYASLLAAGFHVRLSGLDIGRGSFFHRQCIWHDQDAAVDGQGMHVPLRHLGGRQGVFSVFDTPLSEEAVLGFEYGYSVSSGDTLVAWEAQFGDFVNNAQVIIDQFIASGEAKWGYRSGLTMLLPHGYEGGGSEHSSAYVGRFLSLCAEHNMVVCMPSTSAQMFHLLRRQMIAGVRKPLVVFTPKGQLYGLSASHSPWADFERPGFRALMGGTAPVLDAQVERVVMSSGKIGLALDDALLARPDPRVALLRLEQLYPLPEQEIRARLARFPRLSEVVWTQEEARNHGAWSALRDALEAALAPGIALRCVSRPDAAASAGCRRAAHAAGQEALLRAALGGDDRPVVPSAPSGDLPAPGADRVNSPSWPGSMAGAR